MPTGTEPQGQACEAEVLTTFYQVLAETQLARRRFGDTAVAAVLEPYVGATRWPSGAPLPLSLVQAAAQHRHGLLPKHVYLDFCFALYIGMQLGVFFSPVGAMLISLDPSCSPSGVLCYYVAVHLLPVAGGLLYPICSSSRHCERHVRVLYLLLFLDRAGPVAAAQLLRKFRESQVFSFFRPSVSARGLNLPPLIVAAAEP